MKEDQTQLITARLEHLQFMMDNGKMPIFRHRSDMFIFAMEAYNIARGLSSRYYRLKEDLDIRFFVRFRFDYWLQEIQKWIEQLDGNEYRVEDDNFFAEGRAKRLTIVVDKLFGYHTSQLPPDSADGSMPLPEEEILEPFKAVLDMKTTALVTSFKEALQEVHKYLLKLAMLPVEWSEESRKKALHLYLEDSFGKAHVQKELNNYSYFCHMPGSQSVKSQFCYLRQRLAVLTNNGELVQLNLSQSKQQEFLDKVHILFDKDEIRTKEEQLPPNAQAMADDVQFAQFLYFVHFDNEKSFPVLDENIVSNYLIRKDVFLSIPQEKNLQALFALMGAMKSYFDPILEKRGAGSQFGVRKQQRIDVVMREIKKYNGMLVPLIADGRKIEELNEFFKRLFSPEWAEEYGEAQEELLELLEKDHNSIKLEPYVHLLRVAHNLMNIFAKKTAMGKEIYRYFEGKAIVQDANEDTVNSYYSKVDYRKKDSWEEAIELVEAVEEEYKNA